MNEYVIWIYYSFEWHFRMNVIAKWIVLLIIYYSINFYHKMFKQGNHQNIKSDAFYNRYIHHMSQIKEAVINRERSLRENFQYLARSSSHHNILVHIRYTYYRMDAMWCNFIAPTPNPNSIVLYQNYKTRVALCGIEPCL